MSLVDNTLINLFGLEDKTESYSQSNGILKIKLKDKYHVFDFNQFNKLLHDYTVVYNRKSHSLCIERIPDDKKEKDETDGFYNCAHMRVSYEDVLEVLSERDETVSEEVAKDIASAIASDWQINIGFWDNIHNWLNVHFCWYPFLERIANGGE